MGNDQLQCRDTAQQSVQPPETTMSSPSFSQSRGNAFAQEQLQAQNMCGGDEASASQGTGNVITLDEITIEGDPHAYDEVNDQRVQEYIDECYAASNFTEEPDRTRDAWAHALKLRRVDGQDVNLAAAEHYLYAKYSGKQDGAFGAVSTGVMAAGYDAVKAGAFALGVEDWLSTDGTTPSRPTLGSTEWGLRGAADGLSEE